MAKVLESKLIFIGVDRTWTKLNQFFFFFDRIPKVYNNSMIAHNET